MAIYLASPFLESISFPFRNMYTINCIIMDIKRENEGRVNDKIGNRGFSKDTC